MSLDDSFKKPGSIPFKWEVRPGVPKIHGSQHLLQLPYRNHHDPQEEEEPLSNHSRSYLRTPRMLRPPPAGRLYYQPAPEPRTRSFRSSPRTRSERYRFDLSGITSPLLKRVTAKLRSPKTLPVPEPEYCSDLETLSRWSVSSRKSLSPFNESPVSSSLSSNESSSPRPASDAEWAGFALF